MKRTVTSVGRDVSGPRTQKLAGGAWTAQPDRRRGRERERVRAQILIKRECFSAATATRRNTGSRSELPGVQK